MARYAVDPDAVTLTLDLARRMGYAVGSLRRLEKYGYYDLSPGMDLGDLFNNCQAAIHDLCVMYQPARVVVEAPIPITGQTAQSTAEQQYGLDMASRAYCRLKLIQWHRVTPATARKVVIGKAHFGGSEAAKRAVMDWARSHGWAPQTHDVADALVLLVHDLGGIPGSRAEASAA